jgi:hypothetical protein
MAHLPQGHTLSTQAYSAVRPKCRARSIYFPAVQLCLLIEHLVNAQVPLTSIGI